ncbi:MAG: dTDP-4-dehydrorhamnose reductase [Solimicrobium sp.]|jgi:dTDP-4-dehydrorhamnose reductase|nr:dTDP-4-dehydrorhamnose reductase [Solimicrobium sp.]
MKILLFGKNGQLGWELQRSLAPLGEVLALDSRSEGPCGNFANLYGISQTIRSFAPTIIVNAAAYTAVDKAERDIDTAHTVNAVAPALLAHEARRSGAWLIHYSTDYVFDGSGDQYWKEIDSAHPLNVYGKTKLAGDIAIREAGCQHFIFRTSWVYAARGGNFAKTILRLAQERDQLNVINDQFGAPTSAELLADVTAQCIQQALGWPIQRPDVSGLYNVAAGGVTSWYDYAQFVIELARKANSSIKVPHNALKPVPTSSFSLLAQRPHNSRLDTQKLQSTFNLTLPHWQSGVHRMLMEIIENK